MKTMLSQDCHLMPLTEKSLIADEVVFQITSLHAY